MNALVNSDRVRDWSNSVILLCKCSNDDFKILSYSALTFLSSTGNYTTSELMLHKLLIYGLLHRRAAGNCAWWRLAPPELFYYYKSYLRDERFVVI